MLKGLRARHPGTKLCRGLHKRDSPLEWLQSLKEPWATEPLTLAERLWIPHNPLKETWLNLDPVELIVDLDITESTVINSSLLTQRRFLA